MNTAKELFTEFTKKRPKIEITARNVSQFFEDPFTLWAKYNAPEEEKDPLDEYQKLQFDMGNKHEEEVIEEDYPNAKEIRFEDELDGFLQVLENMVKGVSAITNAPIFHSELGLKGWIDILERDDSYPSNLGNYHYIIKEVKDAKNIKMKHIYQAAVYNKIIGDIQGFTPDYIYIINRDKEVIPYEYNTKLEEEIIDSLSDMRKIISGVKDITPTYNTSTWPWVSFANRLAIEMNDISLVPNLGYKTKLKLNLVGVHTLEHLSKTPLGNLVKIKGIGNKTANDYIQRARAILKDEIINLNLEAINFENKEVEIFLDFEGADSDDKKSETEQIIYLIGLIEKRQKKEKFIPFVAHQIDQEGDALIQFTDYIDRLDDFVIYHYHHYERTHIKKLFDKYDISENKRNKILDNMVDIYRILIKSCVFPTFGNGLKDIAKYLGFRWRHSDVNALESVALYLKKGDIN